jgi:hypothetical protein
VEIASAAAESAQSDSVEQGFEKTVDIMLSVLVMMK